MKKVAVIALYHQLYPNLVLFGQRRDNGKFAMPGGHFEPNEHPLDAARRELKEETGLEVFPVFQKKKLYIVDGDKLEVYLFSARYSGIPVTNKLDPDAEFHFFEFLDPTRKDISWHVPPERNILLT